VPPGLHACTLQVTLVASSKPMELLAFGRVRGKCCAAKPRAAEDWCGSNTAQNGPQ